MITLSAHPLGDYSVEGLHVTLPGSPEFPRFTWLDSDVPQKAAEVVAELCRENNIEPVVRVGGNSKGYASLKHHDGVTDLGTPIKHFPWDLLQQLLTAESARPEILVKEPEKAPEPVEFFLEGDE